MACLFTGARRRGLARMRATRRPTADMRKPLRGLAASLALLVLAGCTDVTRGSLQSARMAWQGPAKLSLSAQEVQAKPFFQMRVTTATGDAVLNLGNVDGPRQLWYGKASIVVVMEHGRVTQTMGFSQNLDGSRVPAANPFVDGLHKLRGPVTYEREEDWSPGYRFGIPLSAELTPLGATDIEILGTAHHVLLVSEQLTAPRAGYRAVNRYWVDPEDGFIWKSEQQVMPGLTLQMVQLRPYRDAAQ